MDSSFWFMLLKIIIFLPAVLILFYLSVKYGGSRLQQLQNGRLIKVMERVPLSKDNSLVVVKIGKKGYVLSSSNSRIEKLLELSEEELLEMDSTKELPQYSSLKEAYEKVFKKKEDKL